MFRLLKIVVFLFALPSSAQTFLDSAKPSGNRTFPPSENNQVDSDEPHSDRAPLVGLLLRPYLLVGPSLMESGYAAFAFRVQGGIDVEGRRVIVFAKATCDNGREVNDGDQPNPNGYDRYFASGIYFILPGHWISGNWFAGAGWRWNQLWTTNYTKNGDRPQIGGGYDLVRRTCPLCKPAFPLRIEINWVTAGNDWQNGDHGPEISFTYPSPREKRHWFGQETIGIFRFHETVTEPSNLPLTQAQRSQFAITSTVNFGVMYRF